MSTLNGGPGNIVTNGLVLYLDAANYLSYTSGSTAWYDLSGNNNTGTLTNGPTYSSANAGAIVFDGVNDYVDLGTTSLATTLSSLTLSFYVKFLKINTKQAIISSYTSSPQGGWGVELLSNNTINFFGFSNTTTAGDVQTIQTYNLNQLLNITCVFENSTFIIYVNGIQLASKSGVSTIYKTSTVILGAAPGIAIPFQGNIYTAQIYNRALTASEVLQNFNSTKGRFGL